MRIRLPFAGAFLFLAATAAYVGLSSLHISTIFNDKVLHTLTFFILTTCFYWILDTSRRRTLHLTLVTCTLALGIGSEFLQGFLPNGRNFDFFDIVANLVGSLAAIGLSSWYHIRMLERKRLAKHYQIIPGAEDHAHDLELGEGVGPQESGEIPGSARVPPTLDEEVDHWDENLGDGWNEDEHTTGTDSADGEGVKTPSASSMGDFDGERKKELD
ncbi:VanZ like family protein [Diplocarpon rosae]|nr:VanZ like family protein [Diplocarpon rosae]